MQNFEFRKSNHHRPSDRDVNDGNKDQKKSNGLNGLTVNLSIFWLTELELTDRGG